MDMIPGEWQEAYQITSLTSLTGRIWTRTMVASAVRRIAAKLGLPVTTAAVSSVLDDHAFMIRRRGQIPARVCDEVFDEARLRMQDVPQ